MNENWYAFYIAIHREVTPEQAFQLYWNGKLGRSNRNVSQDEVVDMIKFRTEGMKYKEIGDIYGITSGAVFRRIKYYQKKNKMMEVVKYA